MSSPEQIKECLNSPEEEIRLQGLREISHLDMAEALGAIFCALGDESWRVRKEAVNLYLGLPTAERLSGQVIELLHSEDNAGLRNAAVEILVRLGRPALSFLHEELDCSDHDVRKFVVDILGQIGDESSITYLERMLRVDSDQNVRAAAAENLGKMGAGAAVPALLDALSCPDLLLQFAILEALSQLGIPVPVRSLLPLKENKLLLKPLYDCLGKICGADAFEPLLAGLCDGAGNVREAAVLALVRLEERGEVDLSRSLSSYRGSAAVKPLLEMLSSPSVSVRRSAIHLLGYIGDRTATVPLLDLFDNEELLVPASKALIALGREAVCSLIEVWPTATLQTRTYMAYVFAESGCTDSVGLLTSSLYSGDTSLRVISLRALGRLGSRKDIKEISQFLADDEADVRTAVVDALVMLGQRCRDEVLQLLHGYLSDERADVRCSAVQIAGRLGGDKVEAILLLAMKDESALVRRAAVRFLDGSVPGHCQTLSLALTDEESDVRRQAVESLSSCRDEAVFPALALALGDDDLWVRTATIRAFGRFGTAQALDYVRRGLRDPVGLVTIAALEVLSESETGNIEDLTEALAHPDEEVVIAALRLLTGKQQESKWLDQWGERLLNHHHWDVRLTVARALAQYPGPKSRLLLENRMLLEGEEIVREELRDLLEFTAKFRE